MPIVSDRIATARETLADPSWFAHRYDAATDEIAFVRLERTARQAPGMLADQASAVGVERRALPRSIMRDLAPPPAPLHFILHSGLTGSTQLAAVLDHPGTATTLREPPILSDLALVRRHGGSTAAMVLHDIARLLARPFTPGEAVIVKCTSTGNAVAADLLAMLPGSRALCLHAPLETFLASLARKEVLGRVWGRRLYLGLDAGGQGDLGFTPRELFEQTDLQIAAVAWLLLQRTMTRALQGGGTRVRSLTSDVYFADQRGALTRLADHFGIAAVAEDTAAGTHAKSGEAFDPAQQAADTAAARAHHRAEIDMVLAWAARVAELHRIPLMLPRPLLA